MSWFAPQVQENRAAFARSDWIEILICHHADVVKAIPPRHSVGRIGMWVQDGAIVGRIFRVLGPAGPGQQRIAGDAGFRGGESIRPVVEPQQAIGPDGRPPIAFLFFPVNAAATVATWHPSAPKARAPRSDHQIIPPGDHSKWPLFDAFVAR